MKPLIKTIEGSRKDGKNVLVIAGVHGDELTPIYTVGSMVKSKSGLLNEPLKFVKSITIINCLNISGLRSGSRETSSNATNDLNRMLSNEDETDCLEILKEHIEKNDVVIDIHSSPTCAEFALVDIDEYTRSIMGWCEESNIKCAFRHSGANTIKRYCLEQDKLAVTLEINKMNTVDRESANRCMIMVQNLIKSCPDFEVEKGEPLIEEPVREKKTYQEGIIDFWCKNGDSFLPGTVLCEIFDFEMNKIGEVKAEIAGWVVCEPSSSYVKRGDTLFLIQPI